ncbi:GA module-containing protein, partial [Staphylococcus aureus]|uniref:GA module-containing protein n=1 Tax=Staphylococcus aureus TaxID=1280 RepID=UPI00115CD774
MARFKAVIAVFNSVAVCSTPFAADTQVTNAKTQLNGNHNLEVAKQNANTAIDGLTSLNGPQKAKLKEQVGQATTLPNVQT